MGTFALQVAVTIMFIGESWQEDPNEQRITGVRSQDSSLRRGNNDGIYTG
jgi:hypothetical protein